MIARNDLADVGKKIGKTCLNRVVNLDLHVRKFCEFFEIAFGHELYTHFVGTAHVDHNAYFQAFARLFQAEAEQADSKGVVFDDEILDVQAVAGFADYFPAGIPGFVIAVNQSDHCIFVGDIAELALILFKNAFDCRHKRCLCCFEGEQKVFLVAAGSGKCKRSGLVGNAAHSLYRERQPARIFVFIVGCVHFPEFCVDGLLPLNLVLLASNIVKAGFCPLCYPVVAYPVSEFAENGCRFLAVDIEAVEGTGNLIFDRIFLVCTERLLLQVFFECGDKRLSLRSRFRSGKRVDYGSQLAGNAVRYLFGIIGGCCQIVGRRFCRLPGSLRTRCGICCRRQRPLQIQGVFICCFSVAIGRNGIVYFSF